jgi:hypothetical protein
MKKNTKGVKEKQICHVASQKVKNVICVSLFMVKLYSLLCALNLPLTHAA